MRGAPEVCVMIAVTEACDCCAAIFFVKPAILRRFVRRTSQKGSRAVPKATASSAYSELVFADTVVRRLASYARETDEPERLG